MLVSELEKKAEKIIRITTALIKKPMDGSFKI